jgi:hypothetical protein
MESSRVAENTLWIEMIVIVLLEVLTGLRFRTGYDTQKPKIGGKQPNEKNQLNSNNINEQSLGKLYTEGINS